MEFAVGRLGDVIRWCDKAIDSFLDDSRFQSCCHVEVFQDIVETHFFACTRTLSNRFSISTESWEEQRDDLAFFHSRNGVALGRKCGER